MGDHKSKAAQRFSGLGRQEQAPFVLGQRLPLVGEQLSQPGDRMAHDPPEHVVEVLPGINSAILAGFDEAHEKRRRPAASFAPDKEPVFSTHRDRSHGILRQVVVRAETPVFQVAAQGLALIQGIIDGLPERFRRSRLATQFFDLLEYPRKERRCMLLPETAPIFRCHSSAGSLHLMLKGGQLALGGFEFSGEFPDLGIFLRGDFEDQKILLRDEVQSLGECQYHGKMNSTQS